MSLACVSHMERRRLFVSCTDRHDLKHVVEFGGDSDSELHVFSDDDQTLNLLPLPRGRRQRPTVPALVPGTSADLFHIKPVQKGRASVARVMPSHSVGASVAATSDALTL